MCIFLSLELCKHFEEIKIRHCFLLLDREFNYTSRMNELMTRKTCIHRMEMLNS